MPRAPILLAVFALSFACAATGLAANLAERNAGYIVPVAAGSTDDPGARMPLPPDLGFADAGGLAIPLGHLRGRVVLASFWATWCAPCLKQMVFLDRLQGDLRGQPLAVLAILEDPGGPAAAKAYFARSKLTFLRPCADPKGALAAALGVRGLPTSLIIDKQGRLVQTVTGPYEWDNPQIVARFRMLLAEQ